MDVFKVICIAKCHTDNIIGFLQQIPEEINSFRLRSSVRCSNICPHHIPTYQNFPAPHVSYLDSSSGWLVSCVSPYFLLSSLRLITYRKKKKLSGERCECASWVPAWEWMVLRHRLRSQRETQTLMGLQAEATSREEWCQQQRLALRSVLAS